MIKDIYKIGQLDWVNEIKKSIIALVDNDIKALEVIPYLKDAFSLIKWVKCKRLERFLRTLSKAGENFDAKKRQKFKKVIESEKGIEILADYADTVLRTSSKIGISALALLYSDFESERYSEAFKAKACLALHGISDDLIAVFLAVASLPEIEPPETGFKFCRNDGPYPVYFLERELEAELRRVESKVYDYENLIASVNELIRRGLLLPDYAVGRFGGPPMPFGLGETTHIFKKLLSSAKKYTIALDQPEL